MEKFKEHFKIPPGVTLIFGKVGSGKSALQQIIAKELLKTHKVHSILQETSIKKFKERTSIGVPHMHELMISKEENCTKILDFIRSYENPSDTVFMIEGSFFIPEKDFRLFLKNLHLIGFDLNVSIILSKTLSRNSFRGEMKDVQDELLYYTSSAMIVSKKEYYGTFSNFTRKLLNRPNFFIKIIKNRLGLLETLSGTLDFEKSTLVLK